MIGPCRAELEDGRGRCAVCHHRTGAHDTAGNCAVCVLLEAAAAVGRIAAGVDLRDPPAAKGSSPSSANPPISTR